MRQFSHRVDIRLGYRCNARCSFCYYKESLTSTKGEPSTAAAKKRLEVMRKAGASEVEFTGGEPTIRTDLVELVATAQQLGFTNISMISNGLRLASPRYAEQLVAAGANDFLFSVHGHSAELHDQQTGIKGSFNRIVRAIDNVQALGARCRGSATINGANYRHSVEILGFLVDRGLAPIHLAVFSPVAEAAGEDSGSFVAYENAAHFIKLAIDAHGHRMPALSVKYIPFCFMQGYEQYVMNLYQQSFDPDDWNYFLSQVVRRGDSWLHRLVARSAGLLGTLVLKEHRYAWSHGLSGLPVFGMTRLVELLRKRRLKACRNCRFDYVCDHVWKDYVAHFGDASVVAVPGPKIRDPTWCYQLAAQRQPGERVGSCRHPSPATDVPVETRPLPGVT